MKTKMATLILLAAILATNVTIGTLHIVEMKKQTREAEYQSAIELITYAEERISWEGVKKKVFEIDPARWDKVVLQGNAYNN